MDSCSDPSLRRLHTSLLNEYAAAQRNADPYRIYGKLYEMDRDKATLDYLLNEAMASGREEDVRKYLAEARASYGPTPEYLYKEYTSYKRMGSPRATQLLDSLYRVDPQNEEIVEDLCAVRYAQGDAYLSDEAYREAAQRFDFVASVSPDPELRLAALRKSYSANLLMKRYGQAEQRLDELKKYIEPDEFTVRRTEVMGLRGDTVAALRALYEYLQLSNEVADRDYVAGAYEELAVPYVKGLIEVGNREGRVAKRPVSCRLLPVPKPGFDMPLRHSRRQGGRPKPTTISVVDWKPSPGTPILSRNRRLRSMPRVGTPRRSTGCVRRSILCPGIAVLSPHSRPAAMRWPRRSSNRWSTIRRCRP